MKKPNPKLIDNENPEWTKGTFAKARPAAEVFPDLAEYSAKRKRGQRGPQVAPTKVPMSLRIDHDILAFYKATGQGWQSRINEALRRAAKL